MLLLLFRLLVNGICILHLPAVDTRLALESLDRGFFVEVSLPVFLMELYLLLSARRALELLDLLLPPPMDVGKLLKLEVP
jgi:hypothetical protein